MDDDTYYITVQQKELMGTYWHSWQAHVWALWTQISHWTPVQRAAYLFCI